jgi:hypothetical protein
MLNREDAWVGGLTVVVAAGGAVAVGTTARPSSVGPILAFSGVILVALLTVYTTKRRQVEQLAAEKARLQLQLDHDRELRDLSELRSVLDEATVALEETIHQLHAAFTTFDATDGDADPAVQAIVEEKRQQQYAEYMHQCSAARDRMIIAGQRIAIRMGVDEALDAAYHQAISLVIDTIRQIYAAKKRKDAGERVSSADFKARNSELGVVRNLVVERAVARVRSRLP